MKLETVPFIERQINSLSVHCINRHKSGRIDSVLIERGSDVHCDWIGSYAEYNNHIKHCEFQSVQCPWCHQLYLKRDIISHKNTCLRIQYEQKLIDLVGVCPAHGYGEHLELRMRIQHNVKLISLYCTRCND